MIPGEFSDETKLAFEWEAVSWSEDDGLFIQLWFEDPAWVSIWSEYDALETTFYGWDLFVDESGRTLEPNVQIVKDVPSQIDPTIGSWLEGLANFLAGFFTALTVAVLLLSFFFRRLL